MLLRRLYSLLLALMLFAAGGTASAGTTYAFGGGAVAGCSLSGTTYTCASLPLPGWDDGMVIASGFTVDITSSVSFGYNQSLAMSGTAVLASSGNLDIGGIKGDIAPGWTFDGFFAYDKSDHDQTLHFGIVKSKVQTLLNAADGGASLCAGGFNPFGDANARSLSAACVAYITKDALSIERLSQTQVQFQVNGKLFDLGAGPAQIAFVADYRRNTYSYVPDSDLQVQISKR